MATPLTPDLATLQRWMQELVLHEVDTRAAAKESTRIDARRVDQGDLVPPTDQLDALARLQIYNGGYVSRLVEVLETDYTATKHALGDEWQSVAMAAVYANPSREKNLNPYGGMLPGYLRGRTDLGDHEFLADLSTLEWAMTEAFDAPEFEPFDMASTAGRDESDWAHARFVANPSVRLVAAHFPVNDYLRAVLDERDPERPTGRTTWTAVFRKDNTVWRSDLPAGVAAILAALLDGQPFGTALEIGETRQEGEAPLDVGTWFQNWAADGLFVDVRFEPSGD